MKPIRAGLLSTVKVLLLCLPGFVISTNASAELVELDTDTEFASVYLLETPESPVIRVSLTVLAGEVDVAEITDATAAEGLSHYLEHLMFWHADNVDDLDSEEIHARDGNAFVNGILTGYFNEGERAELPAMFEFVARLFTPPTLKSDFMLRERSVVAREYDLRVSENPNWRIYTDVRRDLYNDLPVSRSVIGTLETINALTTAQAMRFHERFYHPANSVLYITGDFEKKEAELLINERFSGLESGNRHSASWRNGEIDLPSDTTEEYTDSQVNYERLIYLTLSEWKDEKLSLEDWYALKLLQASLDSALDGGIARPLRMDNFVLRSFSFNLSSYLNGFIEMTMYAEPDKGVSLEQASMAIGNTLTEIAATGIPEATLERVRQRMLQTESRQATDVWETYSQLVDKLNAGLDPVTTEQHLNYIKNVTIGDVNDLLVNLATPKRRSVAFIKPTGE